MSGLQTKNVPSFAYAFETVDATNITDTSIRNTLLVNEYLAGM
jgi:hypothetical protein